MIHVRKASWRELKTPIIFKSFRNFFMPRSVSTWIYVKKKHVDHRCSLEKKIISSFKMANNDS